MMNAGDKFDAVVVGGGPAGATTAYLMAKAGLKVCIVEKQTFPRPKTCAGLITWKTTHRLQQIYGLSIGAIKSMGLVKHTLHDYRIYHARNEVTRGRLDFPFHLVDRESYDHFWIQKSVGAGAALITGMRVIQVDPVGGAVQLDSGKWLIGDVVIGADGAWSRVRRSIYHSSVARKQWRTQLAMTIEKNCPVLHPPSYASLHFGFVPWGYAWSFPATEYQIVGIGSLRHKDQRPFLDGFGRFMAAIGLKGCAAPPWKGHPLPFGNYLTVPGRHRVLLVGDACGLADPLLGEGIYYAHRSGELAAQAVIASSGGIKSIRRRYRSSLNRHVIRELRWIKFYRNLLFIGGHHRRFRGLRLFFRLFPKRLEAAIQGQISFGRLLIP